MVSQYLESSDENNSDKEEFNNFKKIVEQNPTLRAVMTPLRFLLKSEIKDKSALAKIIPIVANLFKTQVFDMGVSKNYPRDVLNKLHLNYYSSIDGQAETAAPITDFEKYQVYTQNRTGFVVETGFDVENLREGETIGFAFLDVKNVKGADLHGDSVGVDRANGDIAIQSGNYAVQEAIAEFEKNKSSDPMLAKYIDKIKIKTSFARYGGDEIVYKVICPPEILDYILNSIYNLAQIQAQKFEIMVKTPDGKTEKTRVTFKDLEISAIPSIETPEERELFIKTLTSYGLLLSPEELKLTLKNKNTLKALYDQVKHREEIKQNHLDLIQHQSDEKFLKEYSKLHYCNPVFRYYFGPLVSLEKKINTNLTDVGVSKFKKNKDIAVNVRDSEYGITRAILESFIRYTYEPTFSEVIGTPSLIESMIARNKISDLVVISNQIKGMNGISVVEGDNAIVRSVKDSFIQVLFPDLDLFTETGRAQYEELLVLTPREILARKFSLEELATIGFGKRGPDVYVFATDEAPRSVLDFINKLSKIKTYRSPHPSKNKNTLINIEIGVTKRAQGTNDTFRTTNDNAKEAWARNIAERITKMSNETFDNFLDIVRKYPESEALETRKNYLVNQYNISPEEANLATSFQSWSNRRLTNLKLLMSYLEQYRSFSSTINMKTLNSRIEELKRIENSYKQTLAIAK
jgi:hypothetical protein